MELDGSTARRTEMALLEIHTKGIITQALPPRQDFVDLETQYRNGYCYLCSSVDQAPTGPFWYREAHCRSPASWETPTSSCLSDTSKAGEECGATPYVT